MNNVYYLDNEINTGRAYQYEGSGFPEFNLNNVKMLSKSEMQEQASFNGFDFGNIWEMIDMGNYKFPVLKNVNFINTNEENLTEFAGGDGTYYNPYKISTPEQLNNVRNYLDKNFVLINDIDMEESLNEGGSLYNNGKGFNPIGSESELFTGCFNGNQNSIINLKILDQNLVDVGLFGKTNQAVIANLQIINSEIQSSSTEVTNVGNIIGNANRTIIYNAGASGQIDNGATVGGITGYMNESMVSNCYNYTNMYIITSSGRGVGGIVGISDVLCIVSNCYNAGNIYSETIVGGIYGRSFNYSIGEYLYNVGEISTKVSMSYIGAIAGDGNSNTGNIETAYYLKDCVNAKYAKDTEDDLNAKTKEEMKKQETYEGFDFNNVWTIEEERFPTLRKSNITYVEDIIIKDIFVVKGEISGINYSFIPVNAIDTSFDYSVLDKNIASAIGGGKISGIEVGSTTLSIKTKDEVVKADYIIDVVEEHIYGEWIITKEATETEKGERQRVCSRCQKIEIEEIPIINTIESWDISATTEDSVTAILYKDGTLVISGNGRMKDWKNNLSTVEWYKENKNISKVLIEEGIENIGGCAFAQCSNLIEIEIMSTVMEEICQYAFYECESLKSIILPEKVVNIGDYAFCRCNNLNNITIPRSVTNIGSDIFYNCTNLANINVYCNSYAEEYVTATYSDKLGVIHNYEETSRVEATYEEDGKIVYECIDCSDTYEEVIPKLEEKVLTGISVLSVPTKTDYIQNVESLDLAGGKLMLTYSDESTEEIDMTLEGVTVSGFDNSTLGENIITIIYLDKATVFVVNIVSCEHTYGEWNTTREANCIEVGEKERTCSVCNNVEREMILALGHSFTNYESNNDATCTEDGTETGKCERCTETHTRTEEGSALGHNYEETVVNPTCTEVGYTTHTCSRCQDSYTDNEKAALGHSFTNYISNNDATCLEDGTETGKCERCTETHTRTEEGTALGHHYENGICIRCEAEEPKVKIDSSTYTINGTFISKIASKTTIEKFKESLETNATEIKIYDKNGNEISENQTIATGMKVELKYQEDIKIFTIAVEGDTNGDGKVEFLDLVMVNRHRLNKKILEGEKFIAADFTEDGKVDFIDLVKINRLRLNKMIKSFLGI